ncbi:MULTISPECIES: dUTP diphosphatase [unclassified Curtobacterium]|uniref:dUTP diphosphatase n=1 Tax=Curtobacterium sp. MCBD17_021 TaxID=2175665 RepID=UPI000DA9B7F0|nr:dUTP diphosphatase [Curtobacterium sp. MCBD17_021]
MTEAVDVLWTGGAAPVFANPGDAGADLVSAEAFVLEPGQRRLVGTGLAVALPDGHLGFVVPRSGLAAKHGITVVNAPGTIDAGYRGEVKVALLNTDASEPYAVQVGDRIAQLIVLPVPRVTFTEVAELPDSVRGQGGFGSSGYGDERVGHPATYGVGDARPITGTSGHDGAATPVDMHEQGREGTPS